MGVGINEIVIDDSTPMDHPSINGDGHGLIPRDYKAQPVGSFAPTFEDLGIPVIPRSELSARIKEMEETGSRLSDILRRANNGKPIEALFQNGWGYCWAYSTGHACTALRAVAGLPYVKLSPFAVAHIIKRGANQGGWCGLSAEFVMKEGIPSQDLWPNLKAGLQQDTPQLRENMKSNRVTEGFIDLNVPAYDRNLTLDQVLTLLVMRVPVMVDFNWWTHSVCALDPVEVEPGAFGLRIVNSHGTDYESQLMVLTGSKAIPQGAVGLRVITAS